MEALWEGVIAANLVEVRGRIAAAAAACRANAGQR